MPQPWYRQFKKPKPAATTGGRNWATWQPTSYMTADQANRLQAAQLYKRYGSLGIPPGTSPEVIRARLAAMANQPPVVTMGALGAPPGTSEEAIKARLAQLAAFQPGSVGMPGGTTPRQAREKLANWKMRNTQRYGQYAGYKGPGTNLATTPNVAQAEQPAMLPSYLERFYAGLGPFGPPAPEETTPLSTGYGEGGGGYGGGYGYPYYGWGGGGGVNINFGGGRQQQQIARLPTTPRPDIQGWLQSLINWNIGG
jgi:hypothetical protein